MSDDTVSGVDQTKKKRAARPPADAAVAVSAPRLHDLLEAAAKHADADPELAAAIAHFQA